MEGGWPTRLGIDSPYPYPLSTRVLETENALNRIHCAVSGPEAPVSPIAQSSNDYPPEVRRDRRKRESLQIRLEKQVLSPMKVAYIHDEVLKQGSSDENIRKMDVAAHNRLMNNIQKNSNGHVKLMEVLRYYQHVLRIPSHEVTEVDRFQRNTKEAASRAARVARIEENGSSTYKYSKNIISNEVTKQIGKELIGLGIDASLIGTQKTDKDTEEYTRPFIYLGSDLEHSGNRLRLLNRYLLQVINLGEETVRKMDSIRANELGKTVLEMTESEASRCKKKITGGASSCRASQAGIKSSFQSQREPNLALVSSLSTSQSNRYEHGESHCEHNPGVGVVQPVMHSHYSDMGHLQGQEIVFDTENYYPMASHLSGFADRPYLDDNASFPHDALACLGLAPLPTMFHHQNRFWQNTADSHNSRSGGAADRHDI